MNLGHKIKPLTSIRAFAALWVVFHHLNNEFSSLCPPLRHCNWLFISGNRGVDLFFVLSGFILCYSHYDKKPAHPLRMYFHFVWLRVVRVYPAYLAAMIMAIAFVLYARHLGLPVIKWNYSSDVILPEFFMIQMWSLDNYRLGWNNVDWSVSAEWFAYLFIFPIASILLARIKSGWLYTLAAAIFLLGLSLPWPTGNVQWVQPPPHNYCFLGISGWSNAFWLAAKIRCNLYANT